MNINAVDRSFTPRGADSLNEEGVLPARIIPGPGREMLEAAGFQFSDHPTDHSLTLAVFPEGWTKGPWENHPTKTDQGFCRLVGPDGKDRGTISYNGSFMDPINNLYGMKTPIRSIELSVHRLEE